MISATMGGVFKVSTSFIRPATVYLMKSLTFYFSFFLQYTSRPWITRDLSLRQLDLFKIFCHL